MLLTSKVDVCAVGRSMYFTHDYHVDDEHCNWQDDMEYDCVNVTDSLSGKM